MYHGPATPGCRNRPVPGATLSQHDEVTGMRIYRLQHPAGAGAEFDFGYRIDVAAEGFTQQRQQPDACVYNGTFFDNFALLPAVSATSAGWQIADRNERRERELGEPAGAWPKLDDRTAHQHLPERRCRLDRLRDDGVHQRRTRSRWRRATCSANGPRTAGAASATRWTRRSSASAWPVQRRLGGEARPLEGRRDRGLLRPQAPLQRRPHDRPRRRSRSTTSPSSFAPYQHRQFRIIEFPGYASFAQSFREHDSVFGGDRVHRRPAMTRTTIDYVFYVTAHEVAHQWWAHQVIGADVQGATRDVRDPWRSTPR